VNLQKRPMSKSWQSPQSVLVVLLLALLALPGCQVAIGPLMLGKPASPTLPHGWTWYHDGQFPFDAPIPPGWQAHGYWYWATRDKELCQRRVDLVPPVSQPGYVSDPERTPEGVQILIPNTCPAWNPPQGGAWTTAESTTVDGAVAQQYVEKDDAGIQHYAVAHFGGHQYVFYFNYEYGQDLPQSQATAEIALYNTILRTFVYHGQ
jgi:hypothetical protein